MSKIDELLKNEKVEWKKLGEVCEIKTTLVRYDLSIVCMLTL